MSRYLPYSAFESQLHQLVDRRSELSISISHLGDSVLGRPIYGLRLGTGKHRILMWSQMHGNESSTTRALMMLLDSDFLLPLLSKVSLYIIPVLNPDGAQAWSRNNANNVDLNRDAMERKQPESQILYKAYQDFKPDYGFNLHGQRTIYGDLAGGKPAQISFLAPAADEERLVNETRLVAMEVITAMKTDLVIDIDAFIGRYNDAFNINCVGDFLTHMGVPTILFEAGHAGMDYDRSIVTGYILDALKISLAHITNRPDATDLKNDRQFILENYRAIPEIATTYSDILIKNMISESGEIVDLSIMYTEEIIDEMLHFIPCVVGINDQAVKNAHRVIDLTNIPTQKYDFDISETGVILSTTFEIKIFCE